MKQQTKWIQVKSWTSFVCPLTVSEIQQNVGTIYRIHQGVKLKSHIWNDNNPYEQAFKDRPNLNRLGCLVIFSCNLFRKPENNCMVLTPLFKTSLLRKDLILQNKKNALRVCALQIYKVNSNKNFTLKYNNLLTRLPKSFTTTNPQIFLVSIDCT